MGYKPDYRPGGVLAFFVTIALLIAIIALILSLQYPIDSGMQQVTLNTDGSIIHGKANQYYLLSEGSRFVIDNPTPIVGARFFVANSNETPVVIEGAGVTFVSGVTGGLTEAPIEPGKSVLMFWSSPTEVTWANSFQ